MSGETATTSTATVSKYIISDISGVVGGPFNIYGAFSKVPGLVTVNDMPLEVHWSERVLRATLPVGTKRPVAIKVTNDGGAVLNGKF